MVFFHDTATVENTGFDGASTFFRLCILISSILLFLPCRSIGYTGRVELTDFTTESPSGIYCAKIHYLKDDKGYERSAEVTLWKHSASKSANIRENEGQQGEESERTSEPDDRLLSTAAVEWVPLHARVVDSPVGVILFETMPCPYTEGGSLAFINDRGEVVFRDVLSDLKAQYGIEEAVDLWGHWYRGYYIDERRGFLVAKMGRTLVEISLRDGKKKAVPPRTVFGGFLSGFAEEREIALRWALQSVPDGLGKAATELAEDERQPATIRIMAALAMYRSDGVDVQDVFLECVESNEDNRAKAFATLHLSEVMGCAATEKLVQLLGDDQWEVRVSASHGLALLGECAVAAVAQVVLNREEVREMNRLFGIAALGMIGSETALEALLKTVEVGPEAISSTALEVAIGIKHGNEGMPSMFAANWWDEAPPGFDLMAKIEALK